MGSRFLKVGEWAFVLALGMSMGLLVILMFSVDLRYSLPILGVSLVLPTAVLSGNFKRFFQVLLIASICLPVRKALIHTPFMNHTGGPLSIFITNIDCVLMILYGIWLYERALLSREPGFRIPKTGWYLLGYICMIILSVVNAPKPIFVGFEAIEHLKHFFLLLYIVNHFNSLRMIRMAVLVICVFLLIHFAMSAVQYVTGRLLWIPFLMPPQEMSAVEFIARQGYMRAGGLVGNANVSGAWLVMLLPLLLMATFFLKGRRDKIFVGGTFFLGFVTLVLTGTRGAWIACPTAALILLYSFFKKGLISFRRNTVGIFFAFMLCLVVALLISKPVLNRVLVPVSESEYSRIYMMRLSVQMTLTHPFLGNGSNNYNYSAMPYMRQVPDPHDSLLFMYHPVVHNLWLLISSDTGLLGLFFFCMVLYTHVRNCVPGLKSKDPFVFGLAIALLVFLHDFLIVEMFDWTYTFFPRIGPTFWLLVGFGEIVRRANQTRERSLDLDLGVR